MTVRDPYTGVEIPARKRPPQSPLQRWWPAGAIALVAVVVGYAEWHNAQAPQLRPTITTPPRAASSATTAPNIVAGAAASAHAPSADELARATAALTKANEQLSGTSNLLIGIAALQALVLIGQIYLFGQQRRAARKPD